VQAGDLEQQRRFLQVTEKRQQARGVSVVKSGSEGKRALGARGGLRIRKSPRLARCVTNMLAKKSCFEPRVPVAANAGLSFAAGRQMSRTMMWVALIAIGLGILYLLQAHGLIRF